MKRLFQKNMVGVLSLVLVLGLLVLPSFAQAAATMVGNISVKETGTVSVTFPKSSGFTSTLYIEGYGELFSSNIAAGTPINVGEYEAGQELNFMILVHDTSATYSNGDSLVHSGFVVKNEDSGGYVGFKGLMGENDDVLFGFSNTITETGIEGNKLVQNPEPSTIVLLGSGLLGLGVWRLRKKQA